MTLGLSYGNALGLGNTSRNLIRNVRYWTPGDIDTLAWFDASDDASNNVTNNLVTRWQDLSGNNNHLSPVGPGPNRNLSTRNSLKVNSFPGDRHMKRIQANIPTGDQAWVLIAKPDVVDNTLDALIAHKGNWQLVGGVNNEFHGRLIKNVLLPTQLKFSNVEIDDYSIFTIILDQANSLITIKLNGAEIDSGVDLSPGVTANKDLLIMANRGESQFPDGKMAEIVSVGSVDPAIVEVVEGYLSHKWEVDLPVDHPHSAEPPSVVQIQATEFLTDENGRVINDINGNPVIVQG